MISYEYRGLRGGLVAVIPGRHAGDAAKNAAEVGRV